MHGDREVGQYGHLREREQLIGLEQSKPRDAVRKQTWDRFVKGPECQDKDLLKAVGSQWRNSESRKAGKDVSGSAVEKCHSSGQMATWQGRDCHSSSGICTQGLT